MKILKKLLIFLVVSFKLMVYIINETIWDSSLVSYVYLFLMFLVAMPLILKLKFRKEFFLKTLGILMISFVIFILYKEDNVFLYALVALLTLGDSEHEIVKMFFYSGVIIFGLTILLGWLDFLPMNDVYRTIDGETDIRISLGFSNANAVFSYFLPIVLAGIYLFDKNKKYNILILIIATILFSFCKSRTGYYLILMAVGLNYFRKNKFIFKINTKSFLMFLIISVLLALLFGNSKYNFVNMILSSRPWCYLNYLKLGPLVWGQGVPENIVLDNLYLRLLANYHVIGLGLYYYIFVGGAKLCQENKKILFGSFFILLYGVFEAVTVVNFVIVIFLRYLFLKYREESYGKD